MDDYPDPVAFQIGSFDEIADPNAETQPGVPEVLQALPKSSEPSSHVQEAT